MIRKAHSNHEIINVLNGQKLQPKAMFLKIDCGRSFVSYHVQVGEREP